MNKNKGKLWSSSDHEFLKKNYPIYGAEYCADKLGRNKKAVIAQANRIKIKAGKVKIQYLKENLEPVVKESKTISEVIQKLKLTAIGGNHKTIKKYISLYEIDISHFETRKDRILRFKNPAIPLEEILINGSTYNRVHLKNRLYAEGLKKRECEECGQGELWRGKKMSLILDHKNGVNNDNRIENLRIICPNCNATLPTHAGKNNKKKISKEKYVHEKPILERRIVKRPPLKQLLEEIEELGYLTTGRKYGVSDNSIRKWVKSYQKYGI